MRGFIDIHSHILPAFDDGAKDLKQTILMLQQANDNGTRQIVASTHVIWGEHQPKWREICNECKKINSLAAAEGLSVKLLPGAEVALVPELLNDLEKGEYCINGGCYMLVELPMLQMPLYADAVIFGLQTKGIKTVLAHPERYPDVVNNPDLVIEWLRKGIYLQINSRSLLGLFGPDVKRCAEILIKNRVVTAVASDAHSNRGRNTRLGSAYAFVREQCGAEYADMVFIHNPAKIVNSEGLTELTIPETLSDFSGGWLSVVRRVFGFGRRLK